MKSEFCEKHYETFINHELLNRGYDMFIPSQKQEGELGFDAMIGKCKQFKPLILQYKIPRNVSHQSTYDIFKFNIHKHNGQFTQHNTLVMYNRYGINAVYCAPLFYKYSDLNKYLHCNQIISNSKVIIPTTPLNSGSHHIKYTYKGAQLFSNHGYDCECTDLESLLECSQIYTVKKLESMLIECMDNVITNDKWANVNSILYMNKFCLLIKYV